MATKKIAAEMLADRYSELQGDSVKRAYDHRGALLSILEPIKKELPAAKNRFYKFLPLGQRTIQAYKRLRLPSELDSKAQRIHEPYIELERVVSFGPQQIAQTEMWLEDLSLDFINTHGMDRIKRVFASKVSAVKGLSDSIERLVIEIEKAMLDFVKSRGIYVAGECLEIEKGSIEAHIRKVEARKEDQIPESEDVPWFEQD